MLEGGGLAFWEHLRICGYADAFCGYAVACRRLTLPSLCLSVIRLGNPSMLFRMITEYCAL